MAKAPADRTTEDDDTAAPEDTPRNVDSGTGRSLDTVNKQIVDAVRVSSRYAFGTDPDILPPTGGASAPAAKAGGPTANAGAPIAYQKAAQALAFSVQDAVDYQRNILSMTSAAEGKALQLMFEDIATENVEALAEHAVVYVLSMLGGLAGGLVAEQITTASGKALAAFPRS